MKLHQTGTTTTGHHGVITKVFPNGAIFKSDTGAKFSIITAEFMPDEAIEAERQEIRRVQAVTIGHLAGRNLHYLRIADKHGSVESLQIGPMIEPRRDRTKGFVL